MTEFQKGKDSLTSRWNEASSIVKETLLGMRLLKIPEICYEISEILTIYEKTGRIVLLHEIDYRIDKLTTILKKSLITRKISEQDFNYLYAVLRNFRVHLNRKAA